MTKSCFQIITKGIVASACLLSLFVGLTLSTNNAHATTCSYKVIASNTAHLDGYNLFVDLLADYDSYGIFCGHMYSIGEIDTPPHAVDGTLQVVLTNDHDNDLASSSSYVLTGGEFGNAGIARTSAVIVSDGYASASFQGSYHDSILVGVHTDTTLG
jgi:hypothetical protein